MDHDNIAELRKSLQALEDREAIRELIFAIARGVDRWDTALLKSAILPDAVIDMGGAEPLTGRGFAEGLAPPAEPVAGRMHLIGNVTVTLRGDEADSEAHILSCMNLVREGQPFTRLRGGRYLDRFVRTPDGWRLSRRVLVDEWGRLDPLGEPAPQGRWRGRPAPDDLVYDPSRTGR